MKTEDYKDNIIIPVLKHLSAEIPFTETAVNLILLTAIAESNLFYLKQLKGGPARGLLQMEPFTEISLWSHQLKNKRPRLASLIKELMLPKLTRYVNLTGNLFYGVAMARVKYWSDPSKLPDIADIDAMSRYYVDIYNGGGKASISGAYSVYRYRVLNNLGDKL